MVRAQIYLTETERQRLYALAQETGKSQSELIREAIDQFIEGNQQQKGNKLTALLAAKGMWAERDDIPDFTSLREEFNRKR